MFEGIENMLKVAFSTTLEGVLLTDSNAKIIVANKAIENCLGYKMEYLIGKDLHIFLPKSLHEIHKKHYATYFKDPSYLAHENAREVYGIHKDGRKIALELRLNLFEFEGEKYAKAYISDISKRKKKEEQIHQEKLKLEDKVVDKTKELKKTVSQLRQTNKNLEIEIQRKIAAKNKARKALLIEREVSQLKTKFLSLASHEFRTPLSGILTSATLIGKYTTEGQDKIKKHLKTIKMMVNHLNNILDDFMSLERIETGDIHYKFSYFSFNKLMKEIIKKATLLLKEGQSINYSPCKSCPKIYQDKKIIQIIITNLLFNAIKYSPENTPIDITVISGKYVTIEISDKGLGIPQKDQKNVFKRFFRASNVSHLQGTGIGLNIVKANLEALGGTIFFRSKENEGTTFIVKLPKKVS